VELWLSKGVKSEKGHFLQNSLKNEKTLCMMHDDVTGGTPGAILGRIRETA